jgi:hypothetical protein
LMRHPSCSGVGPVRLLRQNEPSDPARPCARDKRPWCTGCRRRSRFSGPLRSTVRGFTYR